MAQFRKAAANLFVSVALAAGTTLPAAPPALAQPVTQAEHADLDAVLARAVEGTDAIRTNRPEDAIAIFTEVIAADGLPKQVLAGAHYHRGIAYQMTNRYNEAVADYTAAIWMKELPDTVRARAHYNRGTALDNLGEHARAKEDLDSAIALDPAFAPAYNNRGNVLRRMGDYTAAIADYDKSIALGNAMPHLPYFGRAAAKEMLGQKDAARADLQQALNLAPGFEPAQKALAALDTPDITAALTPASDSKLAKAAVPQPVEGTSVKPVETAILPPPGGAPASSVTPAAPAPRVTDVTPSMPTQGWSVTNRTATAPAAAPEPRQPATAVSVAADPAPATPIRTAEAAAPKLRAPEPAPAAAPVVEETPATNAPAPANRWTTRVLPARKMVDAGPALRFRPTETQVAAASDEQIALKPPAKSAPRAAAVPAEPFGTFEGVPAEPYRTAARTPPPATPRTTAPVAVESGYAVQLGSFQSEALAQAGWEGMRHRVESVLGGLEPRILRSDIPGKGVYYRLRLPPLASAAQARDLCQTIKSRGQDCYVAKQ